MRQTLSLFLGFVVFAAWCTGSYSQTQAWKPEKHVEVIVPFAPGTALDTAARSMHSIWSANRWIPTTSGVVNKPGGGGTLGFLYLSQHARDPHYVAISSPTILTNRIIGVSQFSYSDFSPIAILLNEHTVFAVKADSPVQSGRDLVQRLQNDPGALSISVGSALGNSNHIAVALIAKAAGIDPKRLKVVPFASAGAGMTALLGGHVDVAVSSLGVFVPQVTAGTLRLLAVGAPQRLRGNLASVPTWQENGVQVHFGSWRAIFGAKEISAGQTQFWEQLMEKSSKTEEWQAMARSRMWEAAFKGTQETKATLDKDYSILKAVLNDLGMAK